MKNNTKDNGAIQNNSMLLPYSDYFDYIKKAEFYDSTWFSDKLKIGEGAYGVVVKAFDKKRNSVSNLYIHSNISFSLSPWKKLKIPTI